MPASDKIKRASGTNPLLSDVATGGIATSRRRRILLKGALSAPMILTLYNGAALARSSNLVTIANLGGTNQDCTAEIGNPAACVIPESGSECAGLTNSDNYGEKCDPGDGWLGVADSQPPNNVYNCNNDSFLTDCKAGSLTQSGSPGLIITSSSATSLVL